MCKLEHHQGSFLPLLSVCLLCFVYFLCVASSVADTASSTTANPKASEDLIVSTNDGLVSVKVVEAPLQYIIERIGQELSIEVEAQVGENEIVTVEFQDLTLGQAMERLSGNYAYTTDSDGSNVVKLFVFPKGEAAPPSPSVVDASGKEAGQRASSSEPFKFEFDPADNIQEGQ